jgi:hypothetical protein
LRVISDKENEMGKIIQPGGPQQVTAEQAMGAVMRQLEQLQHSINVLSIKTQTLQNVMTNKGLVGTDELETEWNKVVEELKNMMKSAIVTPDGRAVPTTAKEEGKTPAVETPSSAKS